MFDFDVTIIGGECPLERPGTGTSCDFDGICYWGEETCCGETHPSYGCHCIGGQTACFFTDACLYNVQMLDVN